MSAVSNKAEPIPDRTTLSAVLIVKNEENMIEGCLQSLHGWVDEIIVLDSGSADRTIELAQKWGAKVHVREDWQGHGIQRQRAQQLATGDYILAIDADERVSPELRKSIEAILANPDNQKVYEVVRNNRFLGTCLDRHGWHHETLVRLYARKKYAYHSSRVHESVDTRGAVSVRLHGPLLHDTCHNYEYFLEKHVAYAHTWARERAEQGRKPPLLSAILHAGWNFFRLYLLQGGFLDGRYGFLFAVHASHYVFNKYAALWYYGRMQGVASRDLDRELNRKPLSAKEKHAA